MTARGNTDGYSFNFGSTANVTKGRFASDTTLALARQDVTLSNGGASVYHDHNFHTDMGINSSANSRVVVGVENERNTLRLLDSRTGVHVGVGWTVAKGETHNLYAKAGVGYSWFNYDDTAIEEANPDSLTGLDTTPASAAGFLMVTYSVTFSNKMTLTQSGSYMDYFNNTLGHQASASVSLNVPATKHVSFVPELKLEDERNQLSDALGVIAQDRTFTLGVKISF